MTTHKPLNQENTAHGQAKSTQHATGEQCPIKKAGLENNCDERVEFENQEALELHNSKTGKWNQLRLDGYIAGGQGVYAIKNRTYITQQDSQIMQARKEDYNADDNSEYEYNYNNSETESDNKTKNENTKNSMIKEKGSKNRGKQSKHLRNGRISK